MTKMLDALNFAFIQHALIAAVLVSVIAGIVGSLVVVNRMVFLSGGIAHASYGGIGIAVYFSLPIFLGASLFAVASALLVAYLTMYKRERIDTLIGVLWAVGMAVGIVFTDLTPGYHSDLMSYLFGSILAVERSDLYFAGALLAFILAVVIFRYREILSVSYDSEYAALQGINVSFYYTLILVISALSVVVAIKIVGLILVIALLTVPVYIAEAFVGSLHRMMLVSSLLSMFFTLAGLVISYAYDITSGAAIVLVSAGGMMLASAYKRLRR
jgi:zinc transport system permease protein